MTRSDPEFLKWCERNRVSADECAECGEPQSADAEVGEIEGGPSDGDLVCLECVDATHGWFGRSSYEERMHERRQMGFSDF